MIKKFAALAAVSAVSACSSKAPANFGVSAAIGGSSSPGENPPGEVSMPWGDGCAVEAAALAAKIHEKFGVTITSAGCDNGTDLDVRFDQPDPKLFGFGLSEAFILPSGVESTGDPWNFETPQDCAAAQTAQESLFQSATGIEPLAARCESTTLFLRAMAPGDVEPPMVPYGMDIGGPHLDESIPGYADFELKTLHGQGAILAAQGYDYAADEAVQYFYAPPSFKLDLGATIDLNFPPADATTDYCQKALDSEIPSVARAAGVHILYSGCDASLGALHANLSREVGVVATLSTVSSYATVQDCQNDFSRVFGIEKSQRGASLFDGVCALNELGNEALGRPVGIWLFVKSQLWRTIRRAAAEPKQGAR